MNGLVLSAARPPAEAGRAASPDALPARVRSTEAAAAAHARGPRVTSARCRVWIFRAASGGMRRCPPREVRLHLAHRCVARFLGVPAHRIGLQIGAEPGGAPRVALPPRFAAAPSLSVSHSAGVLAIAVAQWSPVLRSQAPQPAPRLGIDIECGCARPLAPGPLPWLAPEEAAAIEAARVPERRLRFLTIWTQKEACLKSLGLGLGLGPGLDTFVVQTDPRQPAGLLRAPADAGWPTLYLQRLHRPALVGALASDARWLRLRVTEHLLPKLPRMSAP